MSLQTAVKFGDAQRVLVRYQSLSVKSSVVLLETALSALKEQLSNLSGLTNNLSGQNIELSVDEKAVIKQCEDRANELQQYLTYKLQKQEAAALGSETKMSESEYSDDSRSQTDSQSQSSQHSERGDEKMRMEKSYLGPSRAESKHVDKKDLTAIINSFAMTRVDRFGRVRMLEDDSPPVLAGSGRGSVRESTSVSTSVSGGSTTDKDKKKKEEEARLWVEREHKWLKMIKNWSKYQKNKSDKLKRRIRKGIPDSLRAVAWSTFAGIQAKIKTSPDMYRSLLMRESEHSETISRDIHRTFPEHVLFRDDHSQGKSTGRESLFNVLKAYSIYDKEVGYCQGMGFIVGIFLMYMSEEESFWMLEHLLRHPKFFLNGLYSPGFPLLYQYFYQFEELMKKHTPKLFFHFQKENVTTQLYATQWFITIFAYNLPFEVVLRIWDIFLSEGPKIVFRLGLHVMLRFEQTMLKLDFPALVMKLKEIHKESIMKDPDALIQAVLKVDITTAGLERTAKDYQVKMFTEKQKNRRGTH